MVAGVILMIVVLIGFVLFFSGGLNSKKSHDDIPTQELSCYYDALSEQAKHK